MYVKRYVKNVSKFHQKCRNIIVKIHEINAKQAKYLK